MKPFLAVSLLASTILGASAFAQESDNRALMDRIDRLQRDISILQRQVARGGGSVSGDTGDAGSAQLEVRLSAIEEELRNLRGKVEENDFQVKKAAENLEKLQKDTDFRLNELSSGSSPLGDAPQAAADAKGKKRFPAIDTEPPAGKPGAKAKTPEDTTGGDGVLRMPDENSDDATNFATPREHYNYAFRLLNQNQYEEAGQAFDGFTKKYPKDPLVGNAYYWEGETYYIKQDYVNAADYFRQGFEALPEGPKAADNLLKLAMSLNALNRNKEACVVLGQVVTKFKSSSTSVAGKAEQEQKRIGCKG